MYPQARSRGTNKRDDTEVVASELKMLKGAHLIINEKVHTFLTKALHDIGQTFSDERADEEPQDILADLATGTFDDPSGLVWHARDDKFGEKVYVSMPYADAKTPEQRGELRVTLLIKKRDGMLALDIRPWGNY